MLAINFDYINGCKSKIHQNLNTSSTSHDQENEYVKANVTPENIFDEIFFNKFSSLIRIDFVEDFVNKNYFYEDELNGKIIKGEKLNSLTFCRDYPKIYGFFNEAAMFNKLISFYGGDFSVRSNRRFICTYNSSFSYEDLTNVFFTFPEKIDIKNSEIILKLNELESKINPGSFRFFYRTETEGVYGVVVIRDDGEKITNYIAAEKNFILFKRGDFEKKLFEKIQMRNGYIEFLLSNDDARLSNPEITFEECLKIFIEEEIINGIKNFTVRNTKKNVD